MPCRALGLASLLLLLVAGPARADTPFVVDRVIPSDEAVEVIASADLAPVEAVVRENAGEALRRAAPDLFTTRTLGPYRYSEVDIRVTDVRYARGASAQQVAITVHAELWARRQRWAIEWNGLETRGTWRPDGQAKIAAGTLEVRVDVGIANGRAVVLHILGDRVNVRAELGLLRGLEVDLPLDGRRLHTHAQPIPPHPSLDGLRPESARLLAIDDQHIQFAVRFVRQA